MFAGDPASPHCTTGSPAACQASSCSTRISQALQLAASGAVRTKTTVLLTPEEVDKATRKSGNYRAPGQQ
jgi:hypothetical protein